MDRLRTGLTEYLSSGEYTANFIDDVGMMISKVYRHWSLYEDFEEFSDSCWAKMVSSLRVYEDGGREHGPLSTYLYAVISNEARRLHSKYKRMCLDDIDDLPKFSNVWGRSQNATDDYMVRDRVCAFAMDAFAMGVYVSQEDLYRNYLLNNLTPAVRAFMWKSIFESSGVP